MRTIWSFHTSSHVMFGRNGSQQLGRLAKGRGYGRVLIVTDPILDKVGILDTVRKPLQEAGVEVEVFTGGEPEPSLQAALDCIDAGKKCKPDALIGLGGGSNMDLAKIAATVLVHGGTPPDYAGEGKIPGPIMPLICVTTTSGTGSEISGAAVFTDTENEMKIGVMSNYLRPPIAIVDPLLTVSCPPKVTADSGIDALTHAIEAYTAVDYEHFPLPPEQDTVYQGRHPFADMLAERAIQLIAKHLRVAVNDGNNLEAREGMSLAATLAGMAFSNVGVAIVHALEYPVGGATHCSHGAGNGLLLPYVMRFNFSARVPHFARIAEFLGEDLTGLNEEEAGQKAIEAVERLKADIGIPKTLTELGVKESQLPGFAEKSFAIKRILRVNPREVTLDDMVGILRSAM